MKKFILPLTLFCAMLTGGATQAQAQKTTTLKVSTQLKGAETKPVTLKVDKKGFIYLFDGTSLNGWRGYAKDHVPSGWTIEDGCLKFTPGKEGGDIIFGHDFENFEFEAEWKISEGGNSGLFYLAQETVTEKDGKQEVHPIYISCPEYQLLDNENHPDAKLGKDNNRQSASLYDMIPAKPQNNNGWGQWNQAKVVVKNGKVTHYQNGKKVLSYKIFSPEWTALLQDSKFSERNWPIAFQTLNAKHAGFVGFQDHGNVVWIRNIKVKPLK